MRKSITILTAIFTVAIGHMAMAQETGLTDDVVIEAAKQPEVAKFFQSLGLNTADLTASEVLSATKLYTAAEQANLYSSIAAVGALVKANSPLAATTAKADFTNANGSIKTAGDFNVTAAATNIATMIDSAKTKPATTGKTATAAPSTSAPTCTSTPATTEDIDAMNIPPAIQSALKADPNPRLHLRTNCQGGEGALGLTGSTTGPSAQGKLALAAVEEKYVESTQPSQTIQTDWAEGLSMADEEMGASATNPALHSARPTAAEISAAIPRVEALSVGSGECPFMATN